MSHPWQSRRLHFVGIGGAGMSGIAQIAAQLGAVVSGSDSNSSSYTERLKAAGIDVMIGHSSEQLPADCELVYSTAIAKDNTERLAAERAGLKQLHRSELLGELTLLKPTVAVSGTHGKTTTSSMTVHALLACGLNPSYVVGGEISTTGTNAEWLEGEWLVVEADESDRSLLNLTAHCAVLTNLELDHHSTFSSLLDLQGTVRQFLDGIETLVVPAVNRDLSELAPTASLKLPEVVDFQLKGLGCLFTYRSGSGEAAVELAVPGYHNALNAACALAVCEYLGGDLKVAAASLKEFKGAGRRFEAIGQTSSGAAVYDDYAHHPTEVAATLAAAKGVEAERIVALFQPHLYSRTAALYQQFADALTAADLVVVTDIYPAREIAEDYPGIGGKLIFDALVEMAADKKIYWLPELNDAKAFLADELRRGDLFLTLGAGDVSSVGRELVK